MKAALENDITSLKKGTDVPLILCSVVLRSLCVIVCVIVFFCVNHSMCESAIGFIVRVVGVQAGPTHKTDPEVTAEDPLQQVSLLLVICTREPAAHHLHP